MPTRRTALTLGLAPLAAPALAQAPWPNKPVTMVVPYGAGGNVDGVARVVAASLSTRLGQQVVVENVTGAGGVIGTDRFLRAAPDGYTLMLGVESNVMVAPLVSPNTARYALTDFAPIALLATQPLTIATRPDLPANDLDGFLAWGRQQPNPITYATSGIGTSLHVLGEMIRQATNLQMEHVPYRVGANILADLAASRIDLAILPTPSVAPFFREGRIKIIGVSSRTPDPAIPQVPPMPLNPAFASAEMIVWQGLFGHPRTDAAILSRLSRECQELGREPAVLTRYEALGVTRADLTDGAFARFLQGESERFAAVVRTGNIRAE
ncbi:Bug family tripartite tricarboxylate transporter substrate binding protein [Roseomonas sp. CCTCC AB2023176]|uniref:Bug family tripartite tricarboxylate transporter substrate binding protein n=1 Tax=Roseomonas sp. CCTCC AB2023176 TaxID=3342640 RepID=UPI0035D54013